MEQLVQVNNGQVCIAEEVLKEFKEFEILKDKMKVKEAEIKAALLIAMENNGIKKFENDFVRINYTAPHVRQDIDRDKLKDQGLFELFAKPVNVKAQVKIAWK